MAGLFAAGLTVALLDAMIPVFIGRVVTLVSADATGKPCCRDHWQQLLGMAAVLLLAAAAVRC